jgi:hypothetical protein
MRVNEFKTNEIFEMAYLYYLGFPHEFERSDPRRVEMIFTGDVALIRGKLQDFWDCNTKVDARGLLNAFKEIKKSLWVGEYDPDYYKAKSIKGSVIGNIDESGKDKKTNENRNTRTTNKQKK